MPKKTDCSETPNHQLTLFSFYAQNATSISYILTSVLLPTITWCLETCHGMW